MRIISVNYMGMRCNVNFVIVQFRISVIIIGRLYMISVANIIKIILVNVRN